MDEKMLTLTLPHALALCLEALEPKVQADIVARGLLDYIRDRAIAGFMAKHKGPYAHGHFRNTLQ
jgi:hypothetical protein